MARKPHQFFIPLLLQKTLEKALMKEERSDVFFRLISNTISQLDIGDVSKESLNLDNLLNQLAGFVENRKPVEKSQKENDAVLIGILQVLRALFIKFPEKTKYYGQDRGLVRELLHKCLFEMPKEAIKNAVPPPKCKSFHSRQAAFNLLLALAAKCDENLLEIIHFVMPIHVEGPWRTKRYVDWHITAKDNEKSLTGYVGLKNLGCICYMNSQLQQLYMIPSFRKALMEVEDLGYEATPREDNILYNLKCIFYGLAQSEKQYINPKGFCHAFKDFDGNPTNVFEQMDSEEFFNIFMDRLENLTKGTKEHHFIKDTFGGVLSNELIADNEGKPLYREREEPFLTIGLQVKNKKSMEQSLKAFIEGEMLEGENAYMWEEANKKCNTLKRACLKRLPNYMVFVLKRFEFDYNTMQRQKLNDYFEFPSRLNLEPYTQQGLRKAEKAKNKKDDAEAKEGEGNVAQADEFPPEYFDYKLTGIVIHLGTAESGHYYSLIQDREADPSIPEEKRWIEFNDTIVTPFDPSEIPNEAFGGEQKWRYYSASDATGSIQEKMKNAYILFYERVTPIKETETKQTGAAGEESKQGGEVEAKVDKSKKDTKDPKEAQLVKQQPEAIKHAVPVDFINDLHEKNKKFHVHKSVFSKEYFDFVSELVFQRQYSANLQMVKDAANIEKSLGSAALTEFELLKTGIMFLLTAVIRDKSRTNIIHVLPDIKRAVQNNIPACQWLITNFTSRKVIMEFFLQNPIPDMRKFVVGLIMTAFTKVFEKEIKGNPQRLYEKDPKSAQPTTIIGNFINCLISLTFDAKTGTRDYSDFFEIFYQMARCGPEIAGYLIKHKYIGRILDFFFEKYSPHNKFFRDMSDVSYAENEKPATGVMKEEKQRVRTALEELLARRKGRTFAESDGSHRSYMWQTLCYLVRHCRLGKTGFKRSKWQIGELDLDVLSEERTLLTPEPFFVIKGLEDSINKISARSITFLYAYLCYEDAKFTEIYAEAIKKGLDKEVSELRPFFQALYQLLSVEDSLSGQRIENLCTMLCKIAKDNNNYYLETDAFTTFTYKLASRNSRAREWFLNNKDQWAWMIQWLLDHQSPPQGVIQSGMKIQKRRLGLREIKAHIALKTRRFQAMADAKIENCEDKWNSDDDLSENEFKLGQQIDYLNLASNKWTTATVQILLEEMINISYGGDVTWLHKDSELLAPHNTMKAHQDYLEQEGLKIEEADAPAPSQDQGHNQGQGQGQGQGAVIEGYANIADDSDSDSVEALS